MEETSSMCSYKANSEIDERTSERTVDNHSSVSFVVRVVLCVSRGKNRRCLLAIRSPSVRPSRIWQSSPELAYRIVSSDFCSYRRRAWVCTVGAQ